MGLEKNEGRRIFLNISDGRIVRQHKDPIEGITVTRKNKNDKIVHEEFFSRITGFVTGIRAKETPFGMVWEITIQDGDEDFVLSFSYSSKYTGHFFRAAPNADFSKPITFNPWAMKDKKDPSKTAIGLSLYQHVEGQEKKQKIEFAFTRENPGKMPDLEQKKIKGKLVYDNSKQLEFFENMLKNDIMPQLSGSVKAVKPEPITAGVSADEADMDEAPF